MEKIEVFYDGSCPLCRREINYYQKLKSINKIEWIDISNGLLTEKLRGLPVEELKRRLHVIKNDDVLLTGGAAFSEIWLNISGFALVGRLFKMKPFSIFIELMYLIFLWVRPFIQKCFGFFENRAHTK